MARYRPKHYRYCRQRFCRQSGISLVEIMISVALLLIGILMIYEVIMNLRLGLETKKEDMIASNAAQEMMAHIEGFCITEYSVAGGTAYSFLEAFFFFDGDTTNDPGSPIAPSPYSVVTAGVATFPPYYGGVPTAHPAHALINAGTCWGFYFPIQGLRDATVGPDWEPDNTFGYAGRVDFEALDERISGAGLKYDQNGDGVFDNTSLNNDSDALDVLIGNSLPYVAGRARGDYMILPARVRVCWVNKMGIRNVVERTALISTKGTFRFNFNE